jgi:hypothetical protein
MLKLFVLAESWMNRWELNLYKGATEHSPKNWTGIQIVQPSKNHKCIFLFSKYFCYSSGRYLFSHHWVWFVWILKINPTFFCISEHDATNAIGGRRANGRHGRTRKNDETMKKGLLFFFAKACFTLTTYGSNFLRGIFSLQWNLSSGQVLK